MHTQSHSQRCARSAVLLCLCLATLIAMPARAALTVTATANVDKARSNELINIEFVAANSDAFARTGVTVTMVFPAGINQIFETEFDGDCPATTCSAGETATWMLGTIPAGAAVMVDIPAFVAGAAADGTVITFAPSVSDDSAASDSDTVDVTVDTDRQYDLSLAEKADPAAAGSQVTYKIAYGRAADAGSTENTQLSFAVPAGTTFVSASDGGILSGGDVEWALGFMAPGDSGIREVTVEFGAGLTSGSVIATDATIASLSTPSQATASGASTAITDDGFGLAIEVALSAVRLSELANLRYVVTNPTDFTRFGVTLQGRFPQSLNQVFESEFDGDCSSTTCSAGELITWALGDLPPGGSAVVDLPPVVATTALNGNIGIFAAQVNDDQGTSSRQTDTLRIQTGANYDLALAENADPALAGGLITYTIDFGRRATAAAAANSRLVFPIPTGTSLVSASGGGSLASGRLEWELGFLTPGDGGLRAVTLQADSGLTAGALIEAMAEIQDTSAGERQRAEAVTVIAATVPLELSIEANPNPARTPELANYMITASNNSAFTLFGVQLEGRFPQHLNQIFESEFGGNCASTTCSLGERIVWSLGDIPAGGAVTVDMPGPVASSVAGGTVIPLFAWVRDDQQSTARQTAALRVSTGTPYDLSLVESGDPAPAGSELTYVLNWGFRADAAAAANSTLCFPLPAGTSFVSASDGGTESDGVIEWPLDFLIPGQGGLRTATLALDGGLPAGEVIEAHADIGPTCSGAGNPLRARADTVIGPAPLSLYLETNPTPARTSELTNHQLTVANNDPFTHFGVVLEARFPESANQSFESEFDGNCSGTTCSSGERIVWQLGDIPAGQAVTVDLFYVVASSIADGTLINLYASARDDQGVATRRGDTIRVQNDTVFDLALAERRDPVLAGGLVDYVLTYGHREDAPAAMDATLRFRVPDGASFVSASGGATLSGSTVEWPVGVLTPGDGDVRLVTVQADAGLAAGRVLEASARLLTAGTGAENARAEADTVIDATVPLSLDMEPNRNNVEAGEPVELLLTVSNNSLVPRFGVELFARYPQSTNQVFETAFDGDCGGTTCSAGERVTWLLGEIGAGSSATVLLPANISGTGLDGTVIDFYAWARDDQNEQTRDLESLLFGCVDSIDADCDAISDSIDNCTVIPNFGQQDTDADAIGNACDPDIRPEVNDCSVNFLDLNAMKAAFFSTPMDVEWNPDADLNSDNAVNFTDLNRMKTFFFGPPGPSAAGCN